MLTMALVNVLAGGAAFARRVRLVRRRRPRARLAPHLVGHPEQQNAACKGQPDDLQERVGYRCERDAQQRRGDNPDRDRAATLIRRQPRGRKADDDRIVAGQREVDQDDLDEGHEIELQQLFKRRQQA
jgi:hypothetical protein